MCSVPIATGVRTTGNYPTACYGIIIITDKQRCADSPGSSNNIAQSLLQCYRVCTLLIHKHKIINNKINLNYNGATAEVRFFLLNSERGLWYDGRCSWFENFWISPSLLNWIDSSDLNSNQISKLCRSLIKIFTNKNLKRDILYKFQFRLQSGKETYICNKIKDQFR